MPTTMFMEETPFFTYPPEETTKTLTERQSNSSLDMNITTESNMHTLHITSVANTSAPGIQPPDGLFSIATHSITTSGDVTSNTGTSNTTTLPSITVTARLSDVETTTLSIDSEHDPTSTKSTILSSSCEWLVLSLWCISIAFVFMTTHSLPNMR